jgi:hypothetical protein
MRALPTQMRDWMRSTVVHETSARPAAQSTLQWAPPQPVDVRVRQKCSWALTRASPPAVVCPRGSQCPASAFIVPSRCLALSYPCAHRTRRQIGKPLDRYHIRINNPFETRGTFDGSQRRRPPGVRTSPQSVPCAMGHACCADKRRDELLSTSSLDQDAGASSPWQDLDGARPPDDPATLTNVNARNPDLARYGSTPLKYNSYTNRGIRSNSRR